MTRNLDRFDLMELAAARSRAAIVAPTVLRVEPPRAHRPAPVVAIAPPNVRGPKYVDHATCPMCGTTREGITYQGMRASGAKIHELAAHSPGYRSVRPKEPRCLGSGMRMAFVDGQWVGEARP